MPPARTQKHGHASSSKFKPNNSKPKRKQVDGGADAQTVPGVQKIKAALRQTRRLLAKDTLAADVRVETERRLKALEADLAKAERVRKEKALAERYHAIKFFERQKVTRKLNQTKRKIEACTDKKEKKKLEKALLELRIDLNYIVHYPKLKKYIALFPPEVRKKDKDEKGKAKSDDAEDEEIDADEDVDDELTEEQAQEKAATNLQREEIRSQIREAMEKGELSAEPEVEKGKDTRRSAVDAPEAKKKSTKTGKKGENEPSRSSAPQRVPEVKQDDFFDNDSEESASSGEDEDRMDED
ncbi:Efg1 domain-containing protein [Phanerochaete sordida]|uniref:rRNA-processing protein EFG1 n=1 Tax=Phanerochaete sordida TaxID=48140 RepID=A0A9P3LL04_9APHY|nr:Efg1 domain-containing protein [Phanerochaete sordida]